MAITITGSKENGTLNAVGTTTVTVSGTPFVSGTYASPRRIDLYNAAGTTFKGCAFVRRHVSTSQLELESEFFDPKTGATVIQVSGDTILVSQGWADVVQAGIAIANGVVTVSDTITFGTASDVDSVAFHDEDLFVQNTVTTSNAHAYVIAGGFVSFGHLQSWANKSWYSPCVFVFNNTNFSGAFTASSTAARLCVFGGSMRGNGSNPTYFGTGYDLGVGPYGTDFALLWALDVKFNAIDVTSPNSGDNWTTGENHIVGSCSYVATGTNAILIRWGNGSIIGGQFKIPRYASAPLAVSGSDASTGTYAFGAAAGDRAVVLDMGSDNVFWRTDNGTDTQTVNCTNLISTDYRAGYGSTPSGSANNNVTVNLYFKDIYTNLRDATKIAMIRDSDWTTDDVQTSSGAASSLSSQVFHSTAVGHGARTQRGPWTYRLRKYGYDELEGAIAEADYSLGTAGTAKNVAFGGIANQIARASLTDSEATALAYAGITVTDHGASPVTWNSKVWSITIEIDLATYPARTAAQVFAHVKAKIANTATWGGKTGMLWHVLMEESGSGYVSQRGKSGGAGASLKGVRIISQAGNPLVGVAAMIADDGTTYTPPASVNQSVTITNITTTSRVQIYDESTIAPVGSRELYNGVPGATSVTWTDPLTAAAARDIRVRIADVTGVTAKEFIESSIGTCGITAGTKSVSYRANQVADTTYNTNAVNGSLVTGITFTDAATDLVNVNLAGGSTTWQNIYAAFVYWISTAAGIADDIAYISAPDTANYLLTSMKVKNTSSPSVPLTITGGYGRDATSGSIVDIVDTSGGNVYPLVDHVVAYATGSGVTAQNIADIAAASATATATSVTNHAKTLTVSKFIGLK